MQIILYDKDTKYVHEVIKGIQSPTVKDGDDGLPCIEWTLGSLCGIKCGFIILERDETEVQEGATLSDDIIAQDYSSNCKPVDHLSALQQENDQLKQQLEDAKKQLADAQQDNLIALEAITELYEMILNTGSGGTN